VETKKFFYSFYRDPMRNFYLQFKNLFSGRISFSYKLINSRPWFPYNKNFLFTQFDFMKAILFSSFLFITVFIGCLQLFDITLEEMVLYSNHPYPLLLQKKLQNEKDATTITITETSFVDLNEDSFIKSESLSSLVLNDTQILKTEEKQGLIDSDWARILLISNVEWFEE